MPKTYTAVTVANATAGNAILASDHSTNFQNVNNLIAPPSCQVVRTTNLTSYTADSDISWTTTASWDTDGMFSAGSPTKITIQTTGLYLITMIGRLTATATITLVDPYIYVNGTTQLNFVLIPSISTTVGEWTSSLVHSFSAGDYFTQRVSVAGGSNYTISGSATTNDTQTRLNVVWIGRTS
jgi:hypothetical protein